jgi:hypothetical protein
MEIDQCEVIQLELKYCERCGGLWMRELGSEGRYCGSCAVQMAEYPVPRRRGPKPKLSGHSKYEVNSDGGRGTTLCCEGGTA